MLFAALTSAISLLETVVATVCDHFHFERKRATLVMALVVILVGIPSSLGNGAWAGFTILGMDFLTFMDFITNSVLMPITALLTCVFVALSLIHIFAVVVVPEGSDPAAANRILAELANRGVRALCLHPGEDLARRLEGTA